MDELPKELRARAFAYGPNEYAWDKADAVAVTKCLASAGVAVTGGEVWAVEEDGSVWGALSQADGGPPAVYHWSVEPLWMRKTESWAEFCQRAATYTISVIETMNVEPEILPRLRPRIRYQLDFERGS